MIKIGFYATKLGILVNKRIDRDRSKFRANKSSIFQLLKLAVLEAIRNVDIQIIGPTTECLTTFP